MPVYKLHNSRPISNKTEKKFKKKKEIDKLLIGNKKIKNCVKIINLILKTSIQR